MIHHNGKEEQAACSIYMHSYCVYLQVGHLMMMMMMAVLQVWSTQDLQKQEASTLSNAALI
jgi:hypothetical protein